MGRRLVVFLMGLLFAAIYLFFNVPHILGVFRGDSARFSDIIAVVCGPVFLVLASVAGLKFPRVAAYWLFAGGVLSSGALIVKTWRVDAGALLNATNGFVMFAFFGMPLIVCGYMWLRADQQQDKPEAEQKSMAVGQGK